MSKATRAISEAVTIVYDEFGDDANFTARDCPSVACSVVVSHSQSQLGDTARVSAKTLTISVRRAQVTEPPRRGDVLDVLTGTFAGQTFTVDSLIGSDEFEHRVTAA